MGKLVSALPSAIRGKRTISTVFSRYALVGVVSNVCGYGVYLLVTWLGVGPKIAMSILYCAGAGLGFLGNRQWSFGHQGKAWPSLLRYCIAHSIGYGLNFSILYFFVDQMHFRHQLVQAVAILVVAVFLFLSFRFFVFPEHPRATESAP